MKAKRNAKIVELAATMTYGEIAKKLGISRETVAGVLFRAKPDAKKQARKYWRKRYRDFPHVRARELAKSKRFYWKNREKINRKKRAKRALEHAA